jgi:L-fuculose-phosphate aldolase
MFNRRRSLVHPRDEIMETMERIYRYRMTTTSGGNLSIRDDDGEVWITPARVDKGNIRRNDIVRVRADGSTEGLHPPSSELPFHQAIYEARPDIRGIVHAHPVALVAFSITQRLPDTRLFHQSRRVCGEVGFAPYALPGSGMLARNIAQTFAGGFHCVVLENHGVVTGGESLQSAFQRFETLEFTAKTIIKAGILGEPCYLDDNALEGSRRGLVELARVEPTPANSAEKEVRRELCDFVLRGYRQRLLISTEGSFSARLGRNAFLVTPSQIDRSRIELEDLVLVRDGAAEAGKTPSRATRLHQAIYDRHPNISAIVNAYPVNATAFSVTRIPLDARTIPESYLLLRDVARLEYGMQFHDPDSVARRVAPDRPIAILENDGVLVCGTSVLDAFDRLEVLETTAEALINSRPLGAVSSMSEPVIEELSQAFFGKPAKAEGQH